VRTLLYYLILRYEVRVGRFVPATYLQQVVENDGSTTINVRGWSGYTPILSVNADIPARQPSTDWTQ
jgi:hypothetical protein